MRLAVFGVLLVTAQAFKAPPVGPAAHPRHHGWSITYGRCTRGAICKAVGADDAPGLPVVSYTVPAEAAELPLPDAMHRYFPDDYA
jgi:hypothetical protein